MKCPCEGILDSEAATGLWEHGMAGKEVENGITVHPSQY